MSGRGGREIVIQRSRTAFPGGPRGERRSESRHLHSCAVSKFYRSRDEAKGAEDEAKEQRKSRIRARSSPSVSCCLSCVGAGWREGEAHYRRDGWSYYPSPSICWQAGSPVWRIEHAASGLDRDVYGCLREVAGVADRSLPGLCVFISPQQRAQIDPAAGTPLAGIVKGKADTPATPAPHPGSQDDGARVDAGAAAGECKEGREGADRASGFVRADPNG